MISSSLITHVDPSQIIQILIGLVLEAIYIEIPDILSKNASNITKELAMRIDNPLDNGMIKGYVSLADKEKFEARKELIDKDE